MSQFHWYVVRTTHAQLTLTAVARAENPHDAAFVVADSLYELYGIKRADIDFDVSPLPDRPDDVQGPFVQCMRFVTERLPTPSEN